MATDVLVALRQALPTLRPAEQRIANVVLENPSIVRDSTITELARACATSLATVTRFCSALGFSGYPEFRMAISSATGREEAERERFSIADSDIDPRDAAEDVVSKIAFQEAQAIEQTAKALDLVTLDAVVAAVVGSSRVDIYGVASSGLTGQDLQQKLHRIGLVSYCWVDPHLALTSAALLNSDSVAISISHSGLTMETVHALEVAAKAGARTVAITNYPDSPLAERADLVLTTAARETRYRSGAMSSRIAQLAVVDFLFVRIAQQLYDRMSESLKLTYDAVQSHRLSYDRKPRA
ncbi:MurR/RpiR family transcriptional regulator [Leifsonia sp. H3M29-4]|uniref:MurR/RpiR family transcriptional regulator n=1 Tax=Salinibacterium metalliresistens TaxID=3031321 RepID=UPI0023D9D463|nr:MurR/RpiR family transcriptional regulator [Salinibacterium metalliresistens]MDF1478284.1 MurR/RpiR family transcriptional regulator [Salinibacterium metalliresistens]